MPLSPCPAHAVLCAGGAVALLSLSLSLGQGSPSGREAVPPERARPLARHAEHAAEFSALVSNFTNVHRAAIAEIEAMLSAEKQPPMRARLQYSLAALCPADAAPGLTSCGR